MAKGTVSNKLIQSHLVAGDMTAGKEIQLKIDQTLTQDATGTLVMLELEAMELDRAKTEVSVQYVDHNLLQEDYKNPDDHLFLENACARFGLWFSRPGNGVSHPVHMAHFAVPGKTLLGADSHTCASGSMGMLAIGAGGLDVALAIAGEPFRVRMPQIWGVKLTGALPDWVSAKDIILEMLRRHDVKGGLGKIIEYYGPGLAQLSAMDRHVIANMGAELGATTTVFPSDERTKEFLRQQGREHDWRELKADPDAKYDLQDEINLSELVPLIAKPVSPGNVVPVAEVEGESIYQSYIGSSANPGYRDFAVAAEMMREHRIADGVSLDINPSSREILENLTLNSHLHTLIHSGARIHQAGCNGCIGMGQAPASGRNSLRTVPRNFPGRSGTKEDSVWLCSPETAAASAITGRITDPRNLKMGYPKVTEPEKWITNKAMLKPPFAPEVARTFSLIKGPNIAEIPEMDELPDSLELPVLLKVADNISTDEILPAGSRVLPFRSNIQAISKFAFDVIDPSYHDRAKNQPKGHAVIGGSNYGQGSSREHAALAPRYLGLRVVIAKDFARIHEQNLANFGILPLSFKNNDDYNSLSEGDILSITNIRKSLQQERPITVTVKNKNKRFETETRLSVYQIEALLMGGVINYMKSRTKTLR